MSTFDAKYRSASDKHAVNVRFSEAHSTPPNIATTGKLDQSSPTSSTPSSTRERIIRSIPTWRGGQESNFVIHLNQQGLDDPFVSSEDSRQPQPSGDAGQSLWRVFSRLTRSGISAALTYHPDKIGVTPTNDTAQAFFPPQACVFIAK